MYPLCRHSALISRFLSVIQRLWGPRSRSCISISVKGVASGGRCLNNEMDFMRTPVAGRWNLREPRSFRLFPASLKQPRDANMSHYMEAEKTPAEPRLASCVQEGLRRVFIDGYSFKDPNQDEGGRRSRYQALDPARTGISQFSKKRPTLPQASARQLIGRYPACDPRSTRGTRTPEHASTLGTLL